MVSAVEFCMQNISLVFFMVLTYVTFNGPLFTVQCVKMCKDKTYSFSCLQK
jgi:hypothetical protein